MRSTVLSFLLLSLWGGAAALAAWVVCRLLRRAHAPSRFLCWLWLAVGLRFVLPFGIPLALPRPQNTQLAEAADTVQALTQPKLTAPDLPAMVPASPAAPAPWYTTLTVWHSRDPGRSLLFRRGVSAARRSCVSFRGSEPRSRRRSGGYSSCFR